MRMKFMAAPTLVLWAVVALAGCADEVSIRHGYDDVGGLTYTNVKSALDGAGGPRQDLLVATDAKGNLRASWYASGPGTWQTATEGALGAAVSAVGTFGAAAVMRPAQTNVSNNSTTSGGSIAPGAASANATGGRGGAGGRGGNAAGGNATGGNAAGGNAAGGNALASPVATASGGNATAAGGTANARAGAAASAQQSQNQNQGPQWNCTNSPPCN